MAARHGACTRRRTWPQAPRHASSVIETPCLRARPGLAHSLTDRPQGPAGLRHAVTATARHVRAASPLVHLARLACTSGAASRSSLKRPACSWLVSGGRPALEGCGGRFSDKPRLCNIRPWPRPAHYGLRVAPTAVRQGPNTSPCLRASRYAWLRITGYIIGFDRNRPPVVIALAGPPGFLPSLLPDERTALCAEARTTTAPRRFSLSASRRCQRRAARLATTSRACHGPGSPFAREPRTALRLLHRGQPRAGGAGQVDAAGTRPASLPGFRLRLERKGLVIESLRATAGGRPRATLDLAGGRSECLDMRPLSVRRRRPAGTRRFTGRRRPTGPDRSFELHLELLRAFVRRLGHALVPTTHREGNFCLGRWVVRYRRFRREHTLSAEKIRILESLPGWTWDPVDARFRKALRLLAAFAKREGHARVPAGHREAGFPLGNWVGTRRLDHRHGRLLPQRQAALAAVPGWSWEPRDDDFEDGLSVLRRFVKREGHARVPDEHREAGFNLGDWVRGRRREHRTGTLSTKRRRIVENLPGWTWDYWGRHFDEGLRRLHHFVRREGHACVPVKHFEGTFPLGHWLNNRRAQYRRGELSRERVRALEALPGWRWRLRSPHGDKPKQASRARLR